VDNEIQASRNKIKASGNKNQTRPQRNPNPAQRNPNALSVRRYRFLNSLLSIRRLSPDAIEPNGVRRSRQNHQQLTSEKLNHGSRDLARQCRFLE
jgi:hypothetical protein